jgi:hypothetical protein
MELLLDQLDKQSITDYFIWEGIVDTKITARGISKAHKQIVQYAKKNQLPEVLIAEDDLKFTSKGAFTFFLENKPSDFDLYLSSIYLGNIKYDNTVDDFSGLTFYIVREKFYDIFLSRPEHDNLDRLMKGLGKFFVCKPFTVIQHEGFSDNSKQYCNYEILLNGRALFKAENC